MNPNPRMRRIGGAALLLLAILVPVVALGQEADRRPPSREELLDAAMELIEVAHFCTLVTLDGSGQPQVRAMEPFPIAEDMVVWMGTNSKSRKVEEIRNDPRVALHYLAPNGVGYVALTGEARLVDDPQMKERYWREGWETFYSDKEEGYILIEVTPERLEVLSVEHGVEGDPVTWEAPSVRLGRGGRRNR